MIGNRYDQTLALEIQQRIDAVCDRFEAAWRDGQRPRLENFLESQASNGQASQAERGATFGQLLSIELAYRRRAGEEPEPQEYAARFPDFESQIANLFRDPALASLPGAATIGVGQGFPTSASGLPTATRSLPATSQLDTHHFEVNPQLADFVPGYEMLGELGRGGMGVVYKAQQEGLGRSVALKMILAGTHAGAAAIQRFRAEAEAVARLQHPNIVQIHAIGEHAGCPYFSLEFIEGGTLAQRCAGVPQPPREAARLVETLARAVHYAHQMGIVHRDLKPANILLTPDGVPKITDFGLAKRQEIDQGATATGMILGTPQYMAPEQAQGHTRDAGPEADVYALGAILYELLTGRPPFQASTLSELLRMVQSEEPLPLRRLKQSTPADLETIALKCLEKEPTKRYASAAALADDLQRYLADQPIAARPVGRLELGWRWCRRNRTVAFLSGAVAMLMLLATIGSLVAAIVYRDIGQRASTAESDAQTKALAAREAQLDTRLELARALVSEARMTRRSGQSGQQVDALSKIKEAQRILAELRDAGRTIDPKWQADLRTEAASALLVPDLTIENDWQRWPEGSNVATTDHHQTRYARVMRNDGFRTQIRQVSDDSLIAELPPVDEPAYDGVKFSRDGRFLSLNLGNGVLQVWDLNEKPPRQTLNLTNIAYAEFTGGENQLILFASGSPGWSVVDVIRGDVQLRHSLPLTPLHTASVSPGQSQLLGLHNGKLRLVDWRAGTLIRDYDAPDGADSVNWHPRGRLFAVSDGRVQVTMYGDDRALPLGQFSGLKSGGPEQWFTPDSRLLMGVDWEDLVNVWSPGSGRELLKVNANPSNRDMKLDATGRFLAFDAHGDTLRRWRVSPHYLREIGPGMFAHSAISQDGNWLAVATPEEASLVHVPSGIRVARLESENGICLPLAFEPEGRALLTIGSPGVLRWPIQPPTKERAHWILGPCEKIWDLAESDNWGISADASLIAAPTKSSSILVRNRTTNQIVRHNLQRDVRNCAVSPDGRWIVAGDHGNGSVTLYETAGLNKVRDLMGEGGMPIFSPDGRWLFSTPLSHVGKLWDTSTWGLVTDVKASFLAFSHDGQLAAAGDGSNQIRFLETASWREVARLELSDYQSVRPLHFSPDGSRLVCLSEDMRLLAILELGGLRAELKRLGLPRVRLVTRAEWEQRNNQIVQLQRDVNRLNLERKPKAALARLEPFLGDDYTVSAYYELVLKMRRDLLAALQRWDEVAEALETRQANVPGDSWAAWQLAVVQLYTKHNEAYETQYRLIEQRFHDPKLDVLFREKLSLAFLLAPRESRESYAPVRELLPEADLENFPLRKPWLHVTLGLLACRLGEHDRADEHFQKALAAKVNPNGSNFYALAHFGRALNEHARGNDAASKAAYSRGQRINFDELPAEDESLDANFWYDWLVCQVLRRQVEQALFGRELMSRKEQIQGAISLQEELLTRIKMERGDKDSHTIEALAELARLQQLAGAAERAIANWKQAYELAAAAKGPTDALTLHLAVALGEAYRNANQNEEALHLLEPLTTLDNEVPEIKHQLGATLLQMNRHEEALPLLQRSFAMPFKIGINQAINTERKRECLRCLIKAYEAGGNHAKVIELGEPLWRTLNFPQGKAIDTIWVLSSLAKAFRATRNFDKAVQYHEELSIATLEKHDPLSLESLVSKHELALAYHQAGQSAKAIPIYEEILVPLRSLEGPAGSNVLNCLNNLAEALLAIGDTPQACERFDQLLHGVREKNGASSREFFLTLHQVGFSLQKAKRFDQAIKYYEPALAGVRTLDKEPNKILWTSLRHLASAYQSNGEHGKAITLFEEALRYLRPQPEAEPEFSHMLTMLAQSYRAVGQHRQSLAIHQEVLDFHRRVDGEDHINVYLAMHNLARGMSAAGDHQQAITLYEQALPKVREFLGGADEQTLIVTKDFAAVLRNAKRFDKAEALYEEVANQRRAKSGLNALVTLKALLDLADAHAEAGHWDQSLKVSQEVVDRLRPQVAANEWRTHRAKLGLGIAQLGLKNHVQAEPLLASFDVLAKQFDTLFQAEKDYLPLAAKRIADLYEAQSLPAQAEIWRNKAMLLPTVNK